MVEIKMIIKLKAMGCTLRGSCFKLLLIIKDVCFQLPMARKKA